MFVGTAAVPCFVKLRDVTATATATFTAAVHRSLLSARRGSHFLLASRRASSSRSDLPTTCGTSTSTSTAVLAGLQQLLLDVRRQLREHR